MKLFKKKECEHEFEPYSWKENQYRYTEIDDERQYNYIYKTDKKIECVFCKKCLIIKNL